MLFCPFVGGVNLHLGLIVPVCGLVSGDACDWRYGQ